MSPPPGRDSAAEPLDVGRFERAVAARAGAGHDPATSLCAAGADVLGFTGVGIMLASGVGLDSVAVSDAATGELEALELMLGAGPCLDAFRTQTNCFDADFSDTRAVTWTAFRERALAVGMRASFGFPLVVADECIGVLNCYRDCAGEMSAEEVADAVVVAHISGRTIVGWQADAPEGTLAWQLVPLNGHRVIVHQAAGRVSVQATVPVEDAMALLHAHAFAHDLTIGEVATEVLAARLRFDA
jgi:hypothetical protein